MDHYNNRYSIAKGVSFVAFGFLFMFLDFNIIADTFYIDLLPDAVGWLLFLMSVKYLGGYLKNPTGMRVFAFVLFLAELAGWAYNISSGNSGVDANPNDMRFLFFLFALSCMVFFYIIHGAMIRVAEDFRALQEKTIRILRPVMLFIQLTVAFVTLFPDADEALNLCVLITGIIAAIVNLVALFGLRKEVINASKNYVALPSEDFDEAGQ